MTVDLPLGATLTLPAASACVLTEGCITCGDVAVVLTVVALTGDADALCRDEDGRFETVAVELAGPVAEGDRLLVHAGVALERLDGQDGS